MKNINKQLRSQLWPKFRYQVDSQLYSQLWRQLLLQINALRVQLDEQLKNI